MTWKRVLTAAVLVPAVVLLVFEASTAVVALAIALVMLFALFEYFALGDAIGHRAYRYWTATCALLIVYLQWLATVEASYELSGGLTLLRPISRFVRGLPPVHDAFFALSSRAGLCFSPAAASCAAVNYLSFHLTAVDILV